jgi:RNA-binding protein with serine-rich domain 1
VAGLTRNVHEGHLKEIFGRWGPVKKVELARDPIVKLSKGFAHVEYKDRRDAEEAQICMDGVR